MEYINGQKANNLFLWWLWNNFFLKTSDPCVNEPRRNNPLHIWLELASCLFSSPTPPGSGPRTQNRATQKEKLSEFNCVNTSKGISWLYQFLTVCVRIHLRYPWFSFYCSTTMPRTTSFRNLSACSYLSVKASWENMGREMVINWLLMIIKLGR